MGRKMNIFHMTAKKAFFLLQVSTIVKKNNSFYFIESLIKQIGDF